MPLLTPSGLVYAEAEYPLDGEQAPEWMQDWEAVRADKAGMVFYHLLQRKAAPKLRHNAPSDSIAGEETPWSQLYIRGHSIR
jgi:hypothetical protein